MEGLLWTDGAYYIEVRPCTCTQRLWVRLALNHDHEEALEEDGVLSTVSPTRARTEIYTGEQYNIPLQRHSDARVSAPHLSPTLGSVTRPLR